MKMSFGNNIGFKSCGTVNDQWYAAGMYDFIVAELSEETTLACTLKIGETTAEPSIVLDGESATIAELLAINEGKLESVSKSRGIKAALTELVNQMEKSGTAPLADQTVFICHANCPDNVEFVSQLLRERFGVTDIRAEFIGPVIGSHTGMGTLGLFFRGEHR